MASVVLKGDTSGQVTISAPAVAGTNTLTLPALTGTVLTNKTAGTVLQVVNATYSTQTSNSTQTLADTGLTATITPSSATSKILVLVSQNGNEKSDGNLSNALAISLLRGATIILTDFANYVGYTGTTLRLIGGSSSTSYLDSPATTSATTYKTQFKNLSTSASATVQAQGSISTITLMEIAA
jgi:hypothetical protein